MEDLQQINELTAQLKALLADTQRYHDEARRYRNECRSALYAAREERGKILLPEVKKGWVYDAIPAFPEPNMCADAGDCAFVISHENSSSLEMEAYRMALLDAGFAEHARFVEGAVTAITLYNDRAVVNLSFAETDRILRAVVDPASRTALPATEPVPDGGLPMVFRGEGDLFRAVDCGMSYTFRLSDGKFLLIDGGWTTPNIADDLLENLYRLSGGKKPEIAAWIFTHAHIDHIGAFIDFSHRYADRVQLDSVIYSFPGLVRTAEMCCPWEEKYIQEFDSLIAAFGDNVTVYKARTGQRYHFAGLELDMLFTFEDYRLPHPLHEFNQTSLVFRIRTKGQSWMFLGDVATSGSDMLVARYGALLQSDIVQVAHHGYPGGTDELYDRIKAPIVLWPAPLDEPRKVPNPARYSDPNWSPITRRMVEKYGKSVYVACEGSTEQTLPLS